MPDPHMHGSSMQILLVSREAIAGPTTRWQGTHKFIMGKSLHIKSNVVTMKIWLSFYCICRALLQQLCYFDLS